MMLYVDLSALIKKKALEAGFDLAGVAPLEVGKDLEFSRHWVEKGFGGEMRYLTNPKRDDLRRILPSARSIICVGLVYNTQHPYSTQVQTDAGRQNDDGWKDSRAWISRYAWGSDYHELMRTRLESLRSALEGIALGVETRVFVDTGPVVERAFARFAGIGWMGKNTCIIHQQKGSWFFLGVILTSLDLVPDSPAPDRCGSCARCLRACPTGALVEPYVMDASRCIAYLNIELKGSVPEPLRPAVGSNLFGCDICQDVCPWNSPRRAAVSRLTEFQPMPLPPDIASEQGAESDESSLFNPPIAGLAAMGSEEFRVAFLKSPLKRLKYRGWLRNLCIVMGNSGDAKFIPWLQKAAKSEDAVVRDHAEWALRRLGEGPG
jgi:epoxyqueuosine reductase